MKAFDSQRKTVWQAARWLSENGYFGGTLGSGGNVSLLVRDAGAMVITPSGKPYHQMAAEDICVIDFELRQRAGKLPPSIETAMHIEIYRKRPDVNAVVHTHQIFASVLSVINQPIPALFDETAMEIGPIVEIVPYAVSGSQAVSGLSRDAGETQGDRRRNGQYARPHTCRRVRHGDEDGQARLLPEAADALHLRSSAHDRDG